MTDARCECCGSLLSPGSGVIYCAIGSGIKLEYFILFSEIHNVILEGECLQRRAWRSHCQCGTVGVYEPICTITYFLNWAKIRVSFIALCLHRQEHPFYISIARFYVHLVDLAHITSENTFFLEPKWFGGTSRCVKLCKWSHSLLIIPSLGRKESITRTYLGVLSDQ